MRRTALLPAAALLLLGSACERSGADRIESKSEVKASTADGKTVTSSEAVQVGTTLEGKTTPRTQTPHGSGRQVTETIIGTVTVLEPGKRIQVMTGEKQDHDFDLAAKDVRVDVDRRIAVGDRVKLVDDRDGSGHRTITVTREP